MKKKLFELYLKCFPDYPVSEETFDELVFDGSARVIERHDGGDIVGFAVVRGSSVSLLCVAEAHRRKGIGSSLLIEAENEIAQKGSEKITLGQGDGYIFQGVPEENEGAVEFFEKHSYSADWSSVNMRLDLRDFDLSDLNIHPCPADVTFRLAESDDHTALLAAVSSVNENWVKYFENSSDPVLLAVQNGTIVGFEFVSTEDVRFAFAGEKIGSVGCVGVIPEARRQGIGLQLVAQGLAKLKDQSCTSAELLYVALVDWYAGLGFKTMHRQWMGRKSRE